MFQCPSEIACCRNTNNVSLYMKIEFSNYVCIYIDHRFSPIHRCHKKCMAFKCQLGRQKDIGIVLWQKQVQWTVEHGSYPWLVEVSASTIETLEWCWQKCSKDKHFYRFIGLEACFSLFTHCGDRGNIKRCSLWMYIWQS
jgi:hypothetical protein